MVERQGRLGYGGKNEFGKDIKINKTWFHSEYLSKRNENICSHKNLYMSVRSSIYSQ